MPSPMFSLVLEGCIEKGRDSVWGGSKYNSSGVQAIGGPDIADSFAAIDQVVFIDKRCSLPQLIHALESNFKGYEHIQGYLLKAPKFGNDDIRADKWMQRFCKLFEEAVNSRYNLRGGPMFPGHYSMTWHIKYGLDTKALPSGRNAQKPLASGISPCNSHSKFGPTAMMNSICSLDMKLFQNGSNFNFTLDNTNLDGEEGVKTVKALVEGFKMNGGNQLQANIFDPKILLEAQKHPEKYPWIIVRISGYTAYFKDLTKEMQQEILDRYLNK